MALDLLVAGAWLAFAALCVYMALGSAIDAKWKDDFFLLAVVAVAGFALKLIQTYGLHEVLTVFFMALGACILLAGVITAVIQGAIRHFARPAEELHHTFDPY